MPKLDRIKLEPKQPVTAEHFNRMQENVERALGGVSSSFSQTLRIMASGSGNTSPRTFPLGSAALSNPMTSAAEVVVLQWRVPTGTFGATLQFALSADLRSSLGVGIFRLRLGGGNRTADGAVVLAVSQAATGSGFAIGDVSSTGPSPGGSQRLKLTVQPSALGQVAQIKDGFVSFGA